MHTRASLARFGAEALIPLALPYKVHIVLGMTIFLLFPFSRLVHMLSAPVRYLWRPGYQIVRSRRTSPLPQRGGAARPAQVAKAPLAGKAARPAE